MRRYLLPAVCGLGVACFAHGSRADVTMSYATAVPTVDFLDQSNFVDDAVIPGEAFNQQAFSDNAGPPGQTFTTPGTFEPLFLHGISLKGANTGDGNSGGNVFTAGTTWGLRVSSVNGTTLTPIRTYAGIPTATGAQGNEWFTWRFTGGDVLTLSPSTQYAFEVFSSAGYLGFDAAVDPASYPAGYAFNTTGAARQFNSDAAQDRGYDRTFHVDIADVPEPGVAVALCAAAVGLLGRRRRSHA